MGGNDTNADHNFMPGAFIFIPHRPSRRRCLSVFDAAALYRTEKEKTSGASLSGHHTGGAFTLTAEENVKCATRAQLRPHGCENAEHRP